MFGYQGKSHYNPNLDSFLEFHTSIEVSTAKRHCQMFATPTLPLNTALGHRGRHELLRSFGLLRGLNTFLAFHSPCNLDNENLECVRISTTQRNTGCFV